MNNDPVNPQPEPPLPGSENDQRRETMLAYYLGALEPEQEALIRGRIETSPEWQSARLEAKTMLAGLKRDGPVAETAPATLAERTLAKLRADDKPDEKTAAKATATVRRPTSKPRLAPTPRSLQSTRRVFAAAFAICLSILGVLALRNSWRSDSAPAIYWRTDSTLAAGGPFAPMLQIRDAASGAPAAANVVVTLADARTKADLKEIGSASTGETGTVAAQNWRVPAVPAGDYILRVQARSALGSVIDSAEQPVKVVASNRLALAPDRTQARPGETIRVRALAVSSTGQSPLRNAAIRFDILDPSGNRINRVETHTSNFGLAWAEFPLDTAAPEGAYKLSAVSEGLSAERTVNVKQYTLPAFQVAIAPAKAWFKKSEAITGSIDAHTYDGQRIADARCELTLMDATGRVLGQQRLEPSADGHAAFKLPWSSTDEGERAALVLQAKVTDGGGRVVESNKAIPVASGALLLSAIAEAQELVPGVANRVYVVARDPEGRGVKSHLIIHRGVSPQEVDTDDDGVAMITLENPELPAEVLEIVDRATGVARRVTLPIRAENNGRLLVRTDRAIVQGGQTLKVTLLCGRSTLVNGVALVALRKDGTTIASRGVKLSGASTETQLEIPAGSAGLYSLETSLQIAPGDVWSDRRAVLVPGSSGVKVVASADRPEYKPGQRARLNFQVSDASGQHVPAAVSVLAVDEALLTLTGDNPGLAQALLSDESGTLMQPDLPLNVREFGPAQGDSPAALAALAKATPIVQSKSDSLAKVNALERTAALTSEDAENIRLIFESTSSYKRLSLIDRIRARYGHKFDDLWTTQVANAEALIDHASLKVTEVRTERVETKEQLIQLMVVVFTIGVSLLLTLNFLSQIGRLRARDPQICANFIGTLTALMIAIAMALVTLTSTSPRNAPFFAVLAGLGLIASHLVLIWFGSGLRGDTTFKFIIITVSTDLYLIFAALVALGVRESGTSIAFILLGATPVLFAQFSQAVPTVWVRIGATCACIFVLCALILPVFGRAREKSTGNAEGDDAVVIITSLAARPTAAKSSIFVTHRHR